MRIKRFLLRYHPPGIIVEYEKRGQTKTKDINLLQLNISDDPQELAITVISNEPMIKMETKKIGILTGIRIYSWSCPVSPYLDMIKKLQSKMVENVEHKFNLVRVIKAHILPITNIAFNKLSTMFATGTRMT